MSAPIDDLDKLIAAILADGQARAADAGTYEQWLAAPEGFAAELKRLTATQPPAEPARAPMDVAVKPLEWHGPDINGEYHAKSSFGTYIIGAVKEDLTRWANGEFHGSLTAAQRSYEDAHRAKARSALQSASPQADERLYCTNCPARFNTVWERKEHERSHAPARNADAAGLVEALEPFARCADELDGNADVPRAPDGEWAKFRLLTDDYRRARAARNAYLTASAQEPTLNADGAPERLWLGAAGVDGEHVVWFDADEGGTPYLRGDLAAASAQDMATADNLERTAEKIEEALEALKPRAGDASPVIHKPNCAWHATRVAVQRRCTCGATDNLEPRT